MAETDARTASRIALVRERFSAVFAASDRKSLEKRISELEIAADRMRDVPLANGDAPMPLFIPALQDRSMQSAVPTAPREPHRAAESEAELKGDLPELARMLNSGEVSSVELARESLHRLDTVGRSLNAVVSLLPDRAIRAAERADALRASGAEVGPLTGIPCAVKDLFSTVDAPTTWGAAPLRDQWLTPDAVVIQHLEAAGAVIVGKVAMVELAGGFGYQQGNAALTGPGRNPWNVDHWAGGSSTGSGAVVAAGCVPYAIGTETWGSITNPSALCGITGFRPTFGSVSRQGAMALSWSMDKIGPMARSAHNCRTILKAIAHPDPADPATLAPRHSSPRRGGDRLRFGVLRGAREGIEPESQSRFDAAVAVLAEIGSVELVDLPDLPWDEVATVVILAEAASAFEEFVAAGHSLELTAPEDRSGLLEALSMPAVDYLRAQRIRTIGAGMMVDLFTKHDLLVAPTEYRVAPLMDQFRPDYYAEHTGPSLGAAGNLCGLPSISLPTGPGRLGLPTAIELMGAAWNDELVLAAGEEFQACTHWHTLQPPA